MNCKSLSYSHHQHMCQNLSINKMLSYFVENASNVLLIVSTWFLMLFLLILYQQFMSHFFLWSIISTKKFSAEWKLWLKTIAGISSRTCYIIPPTFLLRSNLNGAWKPAIKNWPNGKLLSTFDSDNIKIPIYPLNCWKRRFSLFFRELILRCPNIYPLILLTQISLSLLCS